MIKVIQTIMLTLCAVSLIGIHMNLSQKPIEMVWLITAVVVVVFIIPTLVIPKICRFLWNKIK
jgi:hypothetical protein